MRILYVSRSWSGHDERFVAAWEQTGFDVATISADGSSRTKAVTSTIATLQWRLRHRLATFVPDVVHSGPLTDVTWNVAQCWDGPLIATSWGFDLMDEIHRDAEARYRAGRVIARADRLIVDNDAPRNHAIALGANPAVVVQFPWGIDLESFSPGPSELRYRMGWAATDKIIVSTRRHEGLYGVRDIVDAFVRVSPRRPQLRLAIASAGSLTSELQIAVAAASLEPRVTFLGELEQAELIDVYRAADLYVSASSVDGTSVSLLEAMASGAPVLVSDIAGNSEWVTSDTGFTFALGNVSAIERIFDSLAVGTTSFAEDLTRRKENAMACVQSKANWAKTAKTFPELAKAAAAHRAQA